MWDSAIWARFWAHVSITPGGTSAAEGPRMLSIERVGLVLGALVMSSAAIACAAPDVGGSTSKRAMKSSVTTALASSQSTADLGITRWHSTAETDADGRKAATFDGQDKNG